MKKVCIVGLGYIGLPTAIIAAQHGYDVIGVDINQERVDAINSCDPTIEEPEISERLHDAITNHSFVATTVMQPADIYIIAVPTPCLADKTADLSYVWSAAQSIVPVITAQATVIIESTIPVGVTKKVAEYIFAATGLDATNCFVSHCPERVLPGKIFYELKNNNRVIGGITQKASDMALAFYEKFVTGQLYTIQAEAAEIIKLAENSFRDVNIAFAHQIAAIAESCNLEPRAIIEFANKHPRVNILQPSCGVGGHCIALDPWFLIEGFPEQTKLLQAARNINDDRPLSIIQKITKYVSEYRYTFNRNPQVLLLGLTYKPNVDDLRESPALEIAHQLQSFHNIALSVCEPHVKKEIIQKHLDIPTVQLAAGVAQADIIVGLVNHDEFKQISADDIFDKKVLDFCGIFYTSVEIKKELQSTYHVAPHTIAKKELSA